MSDCGMEFYILTLFPETMEQVLDTSILGRARKNGILKIETVDIRDFTLDKHKKTDDYPYGGGAGMVMSAQPIYDAWEAVQKKIHRPARTIYATPQGKVFCQDRAKALAAEEALIFLCGHYEGVDERVLEEIVTDYISIGDYVLTGGELPVMVMVDAISRMVPGVLSNEESGHTESLENGLLEYPQYTRPVGWRGKTVPEVLLSGHHGNIEKWRREQSLLRTRERRPDLFTQAELTAEDLKFLCRRN